jgi:hypothetical protein
MKKFITKKKLIIGATSAAADVLLGAGTWAYAAPYSYVSLDVNPSIEYTLNMFDRVIDVDAVNEDGQAILENTGELMNLTIDDAIEKTIDQIDQAGYLDGTSAIAATETTVTTADTTAVTETAVTTTDATAETVTTVTTAEGAVMNTDTANNPVTTAEESNVTTGNEVVSEPSVDGGIIITVSSGNTQNSEELTEQLRDTVEDMVGDNVEVEVLSIGLRRVEEARSLGVSPGKLNLVEKLRTSSTDPESIVTEEWINKPVKDIMHAIKVNRKETTSPEAAEAVEEAEKLEQDNEQVEESEDDKDLDDKSEKSLKNHAKTNEKALSVNASKEENEDADETEEVTKEKAEEKAKEAMEKAEEKAKEAQEKGEEKAKKAIEKASKAAELNQDAYEQDEDQDVNEDQDEDKFRGADEDQDNQKAWENGNQDNYVRSDKAGEGNQKNRASGKNND